MRQHAESVRDAAGASAADLVTEVGPIPGSVFPDAPSVPIVDLRIVLFTIAGGRLRVALDGATTPRLPRGAPLPHRSLDAEARRIVRETTGLREQYLEQLYTLSVDEPSGWVVTVGYLGLIGSGSEASAVLDGSWHAADELPVLSRTDRMVVDYAVLRLRAKLGYTTIAFHLMPATFTLSELQGAYEAILGRRLDKRNFRRRVIAADMLASTAAKRRDGSHRPALLYRFRAAHDPETYLTPPWAESD